MTEHGLIRSWIQRDYESINGITCPWDGSEAKALTKMLKANPSWTPDEWRVMILNYFESEGVNGERPRVWLPHISKWAAGTLDRFGKLKHPRRAHREPQAKRVLCIKCGADLGEPDPADPDAEFQCAGECKGRPGQ